jgi:hypothetical protein
VIVMDSSSREVIVERTVLPMEREPQEAMASLQSPRGHYRIEQAGK